MLSASFLCCDFMFSVVESMCQTSQGHITFNSSLTPRLQPRSPTPARSRPTHLAVCRARDDVVIADPCSGRDSGGVTLQHAMGIALQAGLHMMVLEGPTLTEPVLAAGLGTLPVTQGLLMNATRAVHLTELWRMALTQIQHSAVFRCKAVSGSATCCCNCYNRVGTVLCAWCRGATN